MAALPQYLMGQANGWDFSPIENALVRYADQKKWNAQHAMAERRMGMDSQRLGFERERLGFDAQRAARDAELAPLQIQLQREQLANAGQERAYRAERHPLELQGIRSDQEHQRAIRPLDVDLKRAQIAVAGQRDVKEVNGRLVRIGPNGAEVVYDGGTNFDKLPEFAAKSAGFAARMVDAERNVRPIMAGRAEGAPDQKTGLRPLSLMDPNTGRTKGSFDPSSETTWALEKLPEKLANMTVRGQQYQQYKQGAEQWIRSFLRKESGAVISNDEFTRDFIVYFPQPGDTPETMKQKERAREGVMRSFAGETRGFFDHVSPREAQQLKEWDRAQTSGPTSPTTAIPRGHVPAPPQPAQTYPYTATNPTTGQKIRSRDGVNWEPAQ